MKNFLLLCLTAVSLVFAPLAYSQSGWLAQTAGTKNLVAVNFVNRTTGYIFTNDANFFKTTNSGINWTLVATGIGESTFGGYFHNENTGYLTTPNVIGRTTNGGLNWTPIILSGALGVVFPTKITFINDLTGYCSGTDIHPYPMPCCHDGVIYKTTNGGLNWNLLYRAGADDFTDIKVKNADSLTLLGFSLYKTTNSGINWLSGSYQPSLYPRSFTNPYIDTIFIIGRDGGIIRSVNHGANWNFSLSAGVTGPLRSSFFIDAKRGHAAGNSGKIFFTSNAGDNWMAQTTNTTKNLMSVFFINKDTGFAVGDSGIVLRTYTGGLTSINSNIHNVPARYTLGQNFPNPFNPFTTIQFDLQKSSFIKLSVYDILGREVERLINEHKPAGSYSIKWDASRFNSGIYFYRIETESFTETRKMMLAK